MSPLRRLLMFSWVPVALILLVDVLPGSVFPGSTAAIVIVLAAFAFLLIHGSVALGWRALALFFCIVWVVSFTSEALGVATGLIFGPYHYTDLLGPKILGVPPLIQVAYIAMSYCSLMVAHLLVDARRPASRRWLLTAVVSAFVMVGWDVSMDPYQSTVSGNWIWERGGAYFGVPMHNYIGWFLTVVVFMVLYLLFARRIAEQPRSGEADESRAFWSLPVWLYLAMALNVMLTPLVGQLKPPIASPANYTGLLESLEWSLTLICTFVMGLPVVLALIRRSAAPALD